MNTNTRTKVLFWGILPFVVLMLACRAASNLTGTGSPAPLDHPTLMPSTSLPATALVPVTGEDAVGGSASCSATLTGIMNAAATPDQSNAPDEERDLVIYDVTGQGITSPILENVPLELKAEQDDLATQQQIWNYFATLIPESQRGMVSRYQVLTDGRGNLLAAVAQTSSDPTQWVLQVDIADAPDSANLTFTMIHEFGHLLTLNADQVPPSTAVFHDSHNEDIYKQEVALCLNYFTGEGCSNPNSYINHFYQRFWSDIYEEWSQIDQIQDERDYYEKMNQFYERYEDRFVSQYASSNPGEDIAESWAYFVLGPKPQGHTIADQKVLFFYEHPELVELRAQILSRLCSVFPQ